MIACYDAEGRITNIYSDPVPEDMVAHLIKVGTPFVEIESEESASDVARFVYVIDEVPAIRPALQVRPQVNGLTVELADVMEGSTVAMILDAGTSYETRHAIDLVAAAASINLDEGGPVRIVITPPWPYLESVHDLDL